MSDQEVPTADETAEALTARLRALIDEYSVGSVADRWPPVVHEAYRALVEALVKSRVRQRDAEYAATQVMLERSKSIGECVAEQQTEAARAMRKPTTSTDRPSGRNC